MFPLKIIKTNPSDPHFRSLIKQLDQDLAVTDGEEHSFYNQFNGTDQIKHVLLGYLGDKAVSCGAFKIINTQEIEIKRANKLRIVEVCFFIFTVLMVML